MNQTVWNKPVEISIDKATRDVIAGPFDALALLTENWPHTRGLMFVRARSACRAALDGRKTAEEARKWFEQAASEAKLLSSH